MKKRNYKQLTLEQRYTIAQGVQGGMRQSQIAKLIGVSQSTVSREIHRNKTEKRGCYSATHAHQLAMERREWTVNNKSVSARDKNIALSYLKQYEWSPQQISGYLKLEKGISISSQSIYNWIWEDRKAGGDLYLHCRHRLKKRKKWVTSGNRSPIPDRISIHERPKEADGTRFGDFEMDLIIGSGKTNLLTITERRTNMIFIEKLEKGKNAQEVALKVYKLMMPYRDRLKTITTDNGTEFAAHGLITKKCNVPVYFADPYSSWQKGAIENANKLIRQYLPKKSSFDKLNQQEIKNIQHKINQRPRAKLNFKTPKEVFFAAFS